MSSYSRQQLEEWLKTIDVKCNSVLDVGGSQLPITKRVKSWKVNDYKILDLETPHECKQEPDIIEDFQWTDWSTESLEFDFWGYFDTAFCMEVSEYWYNPLLALKNINYALKKGGILYISFHFVYPVHNPNDNDYLRYTKAGVEKLLEEAGFEIEEIKPRKFKDIGFAYGVYSREGMRPSKGYRFHDWQGAMVKCKKI